MTGAVTPTILGAGMVRVRSFFDAIGAKTARSTSTTAFAAVEPKETVVAPPVTALLAADPLQNKTAIRTRVPSAPEDSGAVSSAAKLTQRAPMETDAGRLLLIPTDCRYMYSVGRPR